MPYIVVGPLSKIADIATEHGPSHMLTLINEGTVVERPQCVIHTNYLRLSLNDISEHEEGRILPGQHHVENLIDFGKAWPREKPLFIHCWAGVSRSTAAALITLLNVNPLLTAREAAQRLRLASPTATPNRRIIALADRLMGQDGELIAAVDEIGRGAEIVHLEGKPFRLEIN